MKTIAIVGSRDYPNLAAVADFVRRLPKDTCVVSGGARGVDKVAEEHARACGLQVKVFPAKWAVEGRAAGFNRNIEIVKASDIVMAFWDGKSKGTAHTIRLAKQLGKELYIEHSR